MFSVRIPSSRASSVVMNQSCYLHACLMYIQGDALTNKSLRDRFNVGETSAGSISRLIKEAVSQGRIKALNPDTAKRYMRYIPIWA